MCCRWVSCPSPRLSRESPPGLGSIFAHNTQSTRDWLPNVAIALVAVRAERPLSDEDHRLIADLRPHTPRIALVLTKVDLLTEPQRDEVRTFVSEQLAKDGGADVPILMFSTREQPQRWLAQLKDDLRQTVPPPVAISQTFMTQWELLWWLIPMSVFGSLFRHHCANRVPWEVEKNLRRLASDWTATTSLAITNLRTQAATWSHTELTTLTRTLSQRPGQATEIREVLTLCSTLIVPPTQ